MKWNQLPLGGRITLIVAPIVVLVAIVITVIASTSSRDEGSYQYGQSLYPFAIQLWRAAKADPESFDRVHSTRDACKITAETDDSAAMKKFDFDDVVQGCTDALGSK